MFSRRVEFISITLVLGTILLLLVVGGCGPGEEPNPRPTYTPYPTFTSVPTATPRPIYTLYPTAVAPVADSTSPASTPLEVSEVGGGEVFLGRAATAFAEGAEFFDAGDYRAAIDAFKRAQQRHGRPSAILESRVALAYDGLGIYDRAIEHYSNAIAIEDGAVDRVNRAWTYGLIDRCDLAIEDAKAALSLEAQGVPGNHTDVEANTILYQCYFVDGNVTAAVQHVEAALSLAKEHSYPPEEIAQLSKERDLIRGN